MLFFEVEKSTFTAGSPFTINEPVRDTVALSGCVKSSFCNMVFGITRLCAISQLVRAACVY